jgi:hypothetical protein
MISDDKRKTLKTQDFVLVTETSSFQFSVHSVWAFRFYLWQETNFKKNVCSLGASFYWPGDTAVGRTSLFPTTVRSLVFKLPHVSAADCSHLQELKYYTRWFKYDRDKLWLVYTQIVPVIFEPPCTYTRSVTQFPVGWIQLFCALKSY